LSHDRSSKDKPRRTPDDFAVEMAAQQQQHDGLSQDSRSQPAIITAAQEAARRLMSGQAWDDWKLVGRAAQALRAQAMVEAGTNKPEGKRYDAAFGQMLVDVKLDKLLGGREHTALRCRLLELMNSIDDVEKWRATLPTNKRVEWNYPLTIYKHWQRTKVPIVAPADKPPSPMAKLKESVAALSEENTRLKEANGGNLFTARDTAADVVNVLGGMFSAYKLAQISKLLAQKIAAEKAASANGEPSYGRRI
jgi:hypothetical protein